MISRLAREYRPEPPDDFDVEAFEAEVAEEENPYRDYEIYEAIVVERVEKRVRVCAESLEDAKFFLSEYLDKVDMGKDVDSYEKFIETWEYCEDTEGYDMIVPEWCRGLGNG